MVIASLLLTQVARTSTFEVHDRLRTIQIQVAVPRGTAPKLGWPVIYVLDGNAFFGTWAEAVRRYENRGEPAIVVAIGYPRTWTYDSVQRQADYATLGDAPDQRNAASFLQLLKQQVLPRVNRQYHGDRTRQCLVGHSFGGLFTVYARLTSPSTFSHYAAVSPSIWWKKPEILSLLPGALKGTNAPKTLLLVGANERSAAGQSPQRSERQVKARMIENAHELADSLQVEYVEMPQEDHGTSMIASIKWIIPFFLSSKSAPL